jgi:hypothetical protein
MRRTSIVVCLTLMLAACGGGPLTLEEYGAQAEDLVTAVSVRIDELDADLESYAQTAGGTASYWNNRLDARIEFLAGLEALDPPEEAVELHEVVVALFRRLNESEAVLAERVATMAPGIGAAAWWDTSEGRAAAAVDEEVSTICHVAQGQFDQTEGRDAFGDMPWIPTEMKTAVRVAFGCSE